MRRDLAIATALWGLLTIVGIGWVQMTEFTPPPYTIEGEIIDNAFRQMTYMGVPVFMGVVAFLGYSILRFRTKGAPDGGPPPDAPHASTNRRLVLTWLGVSTALCASIIVSPSARSPVSRTAAPAFAATSSARRSASCRRAAARRTPGEPASASSIRRSSWGSR